MPGDVPTVILVGLGKIGLPLAVQYAQHGRRVIGCDINLQVVETINAGQSHIKADHQTYQSLAFSRFTGCQVVLDGRKVLNREHIESLGMRYIIIGDGNQNKPEMREGMQFVSSTLCGGSR